MKYLIKLENLKTGEETFITARAREKAEVLCPKIKVALSLPYTDCGRHRFIARGITYVIEERLGWEQEILWEYDLKPGPYRCSEWTTVERIFTTPGSSILYKQDGHFANEQIIRCTFVRRIFRYLTGSFSSITSRSLMLLPSMVKRTSVRTWWKP
jgi:hypothetical protein